MNEETSQLIAKAHESIDVADLILSAGHPEFAVSRAYYGFFYAAEALLTERGLEFGKHSGVHAAFAQNFIKTAIMDRKFHRWMLDAFDLRSVGDYRPNPTIAPGIVAQTISQAREFLDAVRNHLGTSSPSGPDG